MRTLAPRLLTVISVLLAVGFVATATASAGTIKVTTTTDAGSGSHNTCPNDGSTGDCSLRNALSTANNDTVQVPAGHYVLDSSLKSLTATHSLTVSGAGANSTFIDGNNGDFTVLDLGENCTTTDVVINGVTIENAAATTGLGGGIYADNVLLTLSHVAVTGNTGTNGGGIYMDTQCPPGSIRPGFPLQGLSADHTEISDNTADNDGTPGKGGGIYTTDAPVSLVNVTLSGNQSVGDGSAIYDNGSATIDTRNVTIGGNTVNDFGNCPSTCGGAVASDGEFNPANTLLANNRVFFTATSSIHPALAERSGDCSTNAGGLGTSGDYNIADDDTCSLDGTHDKNSVDPKLGALQNNGGPTRTMAIGTDSPALDYVPTRNCEGVSDDQRGVSRPQGPACDSGAFELQRTGPKADLAETKTASPATVTVGQNTTFTLTSKNNGPNTATGVVVTDTLPNGVTFVSDHASQGSCSGTKTITCSLGTLASGASATVTIVARVDSVGQFVNSANVSGDPSVADPNPGNNHASATVTGVAPALVVAGPQVSVAGARSGCVRSRISLRIHVRAPGGVRKVVVTLGRHRLASTKKSTFKLHLKRTRLKVGHNVLKVVVTDASGRHASRRVPLTRCRVHIPAPAFTG